MVIFLLSFKSTFVLKIIQLKIITVIITTTVILFQGSNIYCLDKNYGGVLIIWDRMFGTFAEEKRNEEIVYGLVYQQPSFNPFHLQVSCLNILYWNNFIKPDSIPDFLHEICFKKI